MSWIKLSVLGGELRVKPRYQMRTAEQMRQVPVLNFGFFLISWWSRAALLREQRLSGLDEPR